MKNEAYHSHPMSLEDDIIDSFEPYDSSRAHGPLVRDQLRSENLSYPRVATILRRWAIENEHVNRVNLYHTGQRYSVAILLAGTVTVELIRETNRAVIALLKKEFPTPIPETYVVGSDFASAPMFNRFGSETIIQENH